METKIKAIFRGQDGSCGYKTDKDYPLVIKHLDNGQGNIRIHTYQNDAVSIGTCEYESINAFFRNWDNIRVV